MKKYTSRVRLAWRYFMSNRVLVAGLVGITVIRVLLSGSMQILFSPGSMYDDIMQVGKAMSITSGHWLGHYGSMTLVKGVGYPLLTAVFHWLRIPYITAYHLLYVAACILFMVAIRPLVKNKWLGAVCYVFLLYNPIAFATHLTKLYRDIGYYSVAFFCVASALGLLLRYRTGKQAAVFGLLAGVTLAFAHNFREDSHWLYIYVAACFAAWFVLRLVYKKKQGAQTKWGYATPLVLVAGWLLVMLPIAWANQACYGTFTIDEYNSGAYAKAYGALKRVDGGTEDPRIVIPLQQRMQLYQLSPAFAELYPKLDAPDAQFRHWKERQGEYRAGYFSFVLRDAVAALGYYETAQTAGAYYQRLAQEVNALCDEGLIEAGPPNYGITARYYPWMTGPVLQATFEGMWQTLRCAGIDPVMVPVSEDDAYLRHYENFVHGTIAANRYMEDGSIVSNYPLTGAALWGQRLLRVLVLLYRALLPALFLAALACLVIVCTGVVVRKKSSLAFWAAALAPTSLLCLFALRSVMIGFVHISSFSAIYNPAYQAASYPVMLAFILTVALLGAQWLPKVFFYKKARPLH